MVCAKNPARGFEDGDSGCCVQEAEPGIIGEDFPICLKAQDLSVHAVVVIEVCDGLIVKESACCEGDGEPFDLVGFEPPESLLLREEKFLSHNR